MEVTVMTVKNYFAEVLAEYGKIHEMETRTYRF